MDLLLADTFVLAFLQDGLQLDEGAQVFDLVQVDPHVLPKVEAAPFGDHGKNPPRGGNCPF
jgi:hypothetical protein